MKKLYFLSVIFLLSFSNGNAQTYYPMLDSANEWTYTVQILGVSPSSLQASPCSYPYTSYNVFRHYTAGDTIIDSLSYKVVMNSDMPCTAGYLREDTATQKVYFIDNQLNPELLLYDFSMQVGDSMPISFYPGQYVSGMYTLDSITTFPIGPGLRRAFHLNCHSVSWSTTVTWVESVGQLNDVLYPYFNNMNSGGYFTSCPGNQHQFEQFLICFSHGSRIFLDSCSQSVAASMPIQTYYVDSCNYSSFIGSVDDKTALFTATLSPNPATDLTVLQLELKKSTRLDVQVFDITGKKALPGKSLGTMPSGKSEISLGVETLSPGIYIVEIHSPEGSVFTRLVRK